MILCISVAISCNVSSFISNFIWVCSHVLILAEDLLILFIFLKNQHLVVFILSIFIWSLFHLLPLWYYYFLPFAYFRLNLFFFWSCSLSCQVRLFIGDLSNLLIYAFIALNLPLRTIAAQDLICCVFILFKIIFYFPFDFFFDSLVIQKYVIYFPHVDFPAFLLFLVYCCDHKR